MAKSTKRKKTHTTHRRRRRGMGALPSTLMNAVYAILGGALGQVLDSLVAHVIPATFLASNPKAMPYIKAGVPLVAGYLLPKFLKNDMGRYGGLGLMTIGGVRLLGALGVTDAIAGVTDPNYHTPFLAAANGMPISQYKTPYLAGGMPNRAAAMYM